MHNKDSELSQHSKGGSRNKPDSASTDFGKRWEFMGGWTERYTYAGTAEHSGDLRLSYPRFTIEARDNERGSRRPAFFSSGKSIS